jgi:hypothetical protein
MMRIWSSNVMANGQLHINTTRFGMRDTSFLDELGRPNYKPDLFGSQIRKGALFPILPVEGKWPEVLGAVMKVGQQYVCPMM